MFVSNDCVMTRTIDALKWEALNWEALKWDTPVVYFHSPEGFYTFVEMLTLEQREKISQSIFEKYHIQVDIEQILQLIPHSFDCEMLISSIKFGQVKINGTVHDFRKYPLQLDFQAPFGSKEARAFDEWVANEEYACFCLFP